MAQLENPFNGCGSGLNYRGSGRSLNQKSGSGGKYVRYVRTSQAAGCWLRNQDAALPVPERYVQGTVATGHTEKYLSKTCRNDSVS